MGWGIVPSNKCSGAPHPHYYGITAGGEHLFGLSQPGMCRAGWGRIYILSVWEMCGFLGISVCDGCWRGCVCPPSGCRCSRFPLVVVELHVVRVFFAVAGSCFSRLPALARVPMGSSFTHERSTTFPWVSSRTLQGVYDRGLRGPWVRVYHCIGGMGVRMTCLFHLYL